MTVSDPETMKPVPWDGETMGEIMFRGNITMKGYLKNPTATEKEFAGGWYHTGDLGVVHPDGYVKIKDRSKDIIISGRREHLVIGSGGRAVPPSGGDQVAIVARPDAKWGEVPCAFIQLKEGGQATDAGNHRVLPRAPGALQSAQKSRVRAAAQDLDRQDSEICSARTGEGALNKPPTLHRGSAN